MIENGTPSWWFKPVEEANSLKEQPEAIEYLKMATGETFIHIYGTAYWKGGGMSIGDLRNTQITHWRLVRWPQSEDPGAPWRIRPKFPRHDVSKEDRI